jgi:hypothetical protein
MLKKLQSSLMAAALLGAVLVSACGGGGSPSTTTTPPTPILNNPPCSTCTPPPTTPPPTPTPTVTMTSSSGDFASYSVNVASLKLARADGTEVEMIPAPTPVDFAQLTNLAEIVSAHQIAPGQYVLASITLDYGNARIVLADGAGGTTIETGNVIDGATSKPLTSPNPTQVTLTVKLDPNDPLVITPNGVANLALDFDLAASNKIAPAGQHPATVTVNPVMTASLIQDTRKQILARGPLVNGDTGTPSFVMGVRSAGQVTFTTTSVTSFAISGTNYTGSEGLGELGAFTAAPMMAAYGKWDPATQTFTASNVQVGAH